MPAAGLLLRPHGAREIDNLGTAIVRREDVAAPEVSDHHGWVPRVEVGKRRDDVVKVEPQEALLDRPEVLGDVLQGPRGHVLKVEVGKRLGDFAAEVCHNVWVLHLLIEPDLRRELPQLLPPAILVGVIVQLDLLHDEEVAGLLVQGLKDLLERACGDLGALDPGGEIELQLLHWRLIPRRGPVSVAGRHLVAQLAA
eukprot:CAMPEP_0113824632 /NCGR_PEP_ID=MMETSP0328-20130328/3341_1 /TAXON_ID=39455 /ORGANISM="Alexandrium minutum" /LENGTH=196 /DNA_ID=CAMNT_0000792575 /DNA_START=351 /DNA_END=937 /DNA_ORIENTATION=- /assembly_acc=CAM_ASM_000350